MNRSTIFDKVKPYEKAPNELGLRRTSESRYGKMNTSQISIAHNEGPFAKPDWPSKKLSVTDKPSA